MENNIVDLMAQDALKRMFKVWGIERTEENIKEICLPNYPKIYECHMRNFNRILGRGGD